MKTLITIQTMNQIEVKHTPDNNIYHDNSQIELSPLNAPEVASPLMAEIPHLYPKFPTEQEVNAIAPP